MFEYFVVVASTIIYFKVFHWSDKPKSDKGTQTDPWCPMQVLDLMDVSENELSYSAEFMEMTSCSDDSSELELPPLVRQTNII